MEWIQVLSLFFVNAGLIAWFRSESRSDYRHLDAKMDASTKETKQLIEAIRADMKAFQETMAQECRDFHGRLCAIEENRRK